MFRLIDVTDRSPGTRHLSARASAAGYEQRLDRLVTYLRACRETVGEVGDGLDLQQGMAGKL